MSTWSFHSEHLPQGRGVRVTVHLGTKQATFADFLQGLQGGAAFRALLVGQLAGAPYQAFRWETPPVTNSTLGREMEFVVLDSPGLARRPEPEAFAEHFAAAPAGGIVTFANLGGDATMVVPCPLGPPSAYGHLAAFVREAPEAQRDALWHSVAEAMMRRVGHKPVWLSTAGAGVAWLHVRLDDRPKYYGYAPYRASPGYA
jgi:hypothetical protein